VENLLKKHAEKLRFAVVGGLNTAIDFVILFTLVALGFPNIAGNYISTSVALIFSFFANKKFTFKHDGKANIQQLALFLVITIFGLWVIQPVIIESVRLLIGPSLANDFIVLLIGKLLATIASLIWNYLLYRRFVFRKIEK
jgi:putative flippase GtrA